MSKCVCIMCSLVHVLLDSFLDSFLDVFLDVLLEAPCSFKLFDVLLEVSLIFFKKLLGWLEVIESNRNLLVSNSHSAVVRIHLRTQSIGRSHRESRPLEAAPSLEPSWWWWWWCDWNARC